jgi:hypothetical protein
MNVKVTESEKNDQKARREELKQTQTKETADGAIVGVATLSSGMAPRRAHADAKTSGRRTAAS